MCGYMGPHWPQMSASPQHDDGDPVPMAVSPSPKPQIKLPEDPDVGLVGLVMARNCPLSPKIVRQTIAAFAQNNVGVAKALAHYAASQKWRTQAEVEQFVGWTVASHTVKLSHQIWERFKP